MRTEGSIIVPVRDLRRERRGTAVGDAQGSPAGGLRIRTALAPEGSVVCAFHGDHVVTDPELFARVQTAWAAMADKPGPTYEQRLAEERRKRIRVVPERKGAE